MFAVFIVSCILLYTFSVVQRKEKGVARFPELLVCCFVLGALLPPPTCGRRCCWWWSSRAVACFQLKKKKERKLSKHTTNNNEIPSIKWRNVIFKIHEEKGKLKCFVKFFFLSSSVISKQNENAKAMEICNLRT